MSQKKINKANMLRDSGKTNQAKKVLEPLTRSKDYRVATNATISLGICYSNEANYTKAIELYKKAIAICEKHGWKARIGSIYRDMAIVTKTAKKYKEAERLFQKSIAFQKRYYDEGQGLNASIGITHAKLGTLYIATKNFSKAGKEFAIARKMLKKGNHEYWSLMAETDYAWFLITQKKHKEAKKIVEKSIPEAIRQEKEYFLVKGMIIAGDCEKALKNKDGAKMFYSMAKITIEKIFDSKEVREKFQSQIDANLPAGRQV